MRTRGRVTNKLIRVKLRSIQDAHLYVKRVIICQKVSSCRENVTKISQESSDKGRDFHKCKSNGDWQKTSSVTLSCEPNGDFFAEKLRVAMNQIHSFEIDVESLTRLNHELRIENEKYHQIAVSSKNKTEQCDLESQLILEEYIEEKEKWTEEKILLENNLQQCSSYRPDNLQPAGHIGISVIRRLENARETDTCVGIITSSGYITSSSCCQADQLYLFEFENSTEIAIEENSIWIEKYICFINTTEAMNFHSPILDGAESQNCALLAFCIDSQDFNEHQIEIKTKDCADSSCNRKIDLVDNAMILEGTTIVCEGSLNFGIVTKSKSLR